MQCQRDGLVPINETLADLSGPVQAHRDASPQSLHHFTQADQVNQLVAASEADPDRGFMARMMALCSLPRTNPGNRLQYKRANGPYKLVMVAGADNKLPYGNLPRLLLAWVCHRSGTDPKRSSGSGEVPCQVYEGTWYLQQRRQSPNPPPQSNEATVRLHRLADLRE